MLTINDHPLYVDDYSKQFLQARAAELGLTKFSRWTKEDLVTAINERLLQIDDELADQAQHDQDAEIRHEVPIEEQIAEDEQIRATAFEDSKLVDDDTRFNGDGSFANAAEAKALGIDLHPEITELDPAAEADDNWKVEDPYRYPAEEETMPTENETTQDESAFMPAPTLPTQWIAVIGSSDWRNRSAVLEQIQNWWNEQGNPPLQLVTSGAPRGAELVARAGMDTLGFGHIPLPDDAIAGMTTLSHVFAFVRDYSEGAQKVVDQVEIKGAVPITVMREEATRDAWSSR